MGTVAAVAFLLQNLLRFQSFSTTNNCSYSSGSQKNSTPAKHTPQLYEGTYMSQGRSTPCIGDKLIQPLTTGILRVYKPLRVDESIPYSMEISWEWIDPHGTYKKIPTVDPHTSGQISIIPKPELGGFWGSSLIKPPFRVTNRRETS